MLQAEEIVYLLDYDSCVGEIHESTMPHSGYKTIYDANSQLNDQIEIDINLPKTSKISLHCYSYRNNAAQNKEVANENKNGCAFTHLSAYADKLRCIHGDKIHLTKILLQDFHQGKPPGATWDGVLSKSNDPNLYDPYVSLGDETKIIITFAHIWHAYQNRNKDASLRIRILDDREEILKTVSEFYKQFPSFLPPDITVEFIHYWHQVDEWNGRELKYINDTLGRLKITPRAQSSDIDDFDIGAATKNFEKLLGIEPNYLYIRVRLVKAGISLNDVIAKPSEEVAHTTPSNGSDDAPETGPMLLTEMEKVTQVLVKSASVPSLFLYKAHLENQAETGSTRSRSMTL